MRTCLKNTFLILLGLVLITGCKDRPPEGLIEQEELVPVLVDLHVVYAIQSTMDYRRLSQDYDSIDIYSYVFDKHGVTKIQFDSTIAWFSRHPKLFTEVYDEVVMQLTQRSDSINPEHQ